MSKLTQVQKAISDLTNDELLELTNWLLNKLTHRGRKAELAQNSPASDCNQFIPALFRGLLVRGSSGSGKSFQMNKLS